MTQDPYFDPPHYAPINTTATRCGDAPVLGALLVLGAILALAALMGLIFLAEVWWAGGWPL